MSENWSLLQIGSRDFYFSHIVVVKELVRSIVPFDAYAGPIAGYDGALIAHAVVPCHALADFEPFGLIGFHG